MRVVSLLVHFPAVRYRVSCLRVGSEAACYSGAECLMSVKMWLIAAGRRHLHQDPCADLFLLFLLSDTDRMSNIEHLRRSSPQGQRRKYQQRSGSHHLQTDRRLLRFFSQTHHVYGSVPFAVKSSPNLTLLSQGSCPSGF